VQFTKTGEEASQYNPPPFPSLAVLREIMQLVKAGEEDSATYNPPPSLAEFPLSVQLVKIGKEKYQQQIPPP
jgi:hypothetical protein